MPSRAPDVLQTLEKMLMPSTFLAGLFHSSLHTEHGGQQPSSTPSVLAPPWSEPTPRAHGPSHPTGQWTQPSPSHTRTLCLGEVSGQTGEGVTSTWPSKSSLCLDPNDSHSSSSWHVHPSLKVKYNRASVWVGRWAALTGRLMGSSPFSPSRCCVRLFLPHFSSEGYFSLRHRTRVDWRSSLWGL